MWFTQEQFTSINPPEEFLFPLTTSKSQRWSVASIGKATRCGLAYFRTPSPDPKTFQKFVSLKRPVGSFRLCSGWCKYPALRLEASPPAEPCALPLRRGVSPDGGTDFPLPSPTSCGGCGRGPTVRIRCHRSPKSADLEAQTSTNKVSPFIGCSVPKSPAMALPFAPSPLRLSLIAHVH